MTSSFTAKAACKTVSLLTCSSKGGSAALYWPLGPRGCYTSGHSSQRSSWTLVEKSRAQTDQSSLSLLHCCSSIPQANPWFSPSILERKGSKTWLESRSIDSQSLRAFGSRIGEHCIGDGWDWQGRGVQPWYLLDTSVAGMVLRYSGVCRTTIWS